MSMNSFWKRTAAALVAVGGLGLFVASGASAQASVNATANAEILAALTVSETTQLDFGRAATSPAAGTVVVSTAGAQSCTGGTNCVGGTPAAGEFLVNGSPSATVDITLPASATVDDVTTGAITMTVDTFGDDVGGSMTLDAVTGAGTFFVGATLNVGANQTADTYDGPYTVNVDYQ